MKPIEMGIDTWVDLWKLNSSEVYTFDVPGLLLKWVLAFEIGIDSCSICKTKGPDDPISSSYDGELILERVFLGSLPNEIVNCCLNRRCGFVKLQKDQNPSLE